VPDELHKLREWAPNTPDLNLLDSHVWNKIGQCKKKLRKAISIPRVTATKK
jgi:hypothetical protein